MVAAAPDVPPTVRSRADLVLGLAVFGVTAAYLLLQPHHLGTYDEASFLLEAKRVLGGERLYADVFWMAMPGPHWAMSGVFGAFGTGIGPARAAMALIHGGIGLGLFTAARAAGVRPVLALLPPAAHLALCQPAWPYASPHWFSTLAMAWLLVAAVRRGWLSARGGALRLGLLLGALAIVYQQKAVAMATGVATLVLFEAWSARRDGSARAVLTRLLWIGAGAALVVLPVVGLMLATAGVEPPFDQLVRHPLTGYRTHNRAGWGSADLFSFGTLPYTSLILLKAVPLLLLPGVWLWVRSGRGQRSGDSSAGGHVGPPLRDGEEAGRWAALVVMCAAATLSIAYFPDFIHIAYIAGLYFVLAAAELESACAALERRWRAVPVRAALATALLIALASKAVFNHQLAWRQFRLPLETAFGRIDFQWPREQRLVEHVDALLAQAPSRALLVYPYYTSLYLTAGAINPTPYSVMLPGYSAQSHYDAILAVLRRETVPYVVVFDQLLPADDPIVAYVREHYVEDSPCAPGLQRCTIYRQRVLAAPAPPRP